MLAETAQGESASLSGCARISAGFHTRCPPPTPRGARVKQIKDAPSVACRTARERGRTQSCAGHRRPGDAP